MWRALALCCLVLWCAGTVDAQQVTVNAIWGNAQNDTQFILYSPDRPLKKSHFLGTPEKGRAVALTKSSMGFSSEFQEKNGQFTLNVEINALFHKQGSWFKATAHEARVLAHEQLHFDLTAYYAFRFLEAVKKYRFHPHRHKQQLNTLYKKFADELTQAQNDYDHQTLNGTRLDRQNYWEMKMVNKMSELQALQAYR